MNGLILIDKPGGCTSHDVVNRWRKLANTRRVGHLGTLDPMASGLLVLMTGTATRLAQFFVLDEKTYQAEITLGKTSNTYDIEGELIDTGTIDFPSQEIISKALRTFEGVSWQTPPAVSAKKIKGVPAYKLARQQIEVKLDPVAVTIRNLVIHSIEQPRINITVTCSSGTYIRSIAHDLGQQLGCGAVLSALRRLRVGEFEMKQARSIETLTQLASENRLAEAVIPSRDLLPHVPSEYVDEAVEARIRQGREFRTSPFVVKPGSPHVKVISRSGELVAIGDMKYPNVYHPGTVL